MSSERKKERKECLKVRVVYWLACVPCVVYVMLVSGSIPSRVTNLD